MTKKVIVFGSTGSIGTSVLDIIRRNPGSFTVRGLAVRDNHAALCKQAAQFRAEYAAVYDCASAEIFDKKRPGQCTLFSGRDGVLRLADIPSDIAVVGINGVEAIPLLYRLVKSTKRIVLANKECLVVAGKFIMPLLRQNSVEFFPADSEMFALSLLLGPLAQDSFDTAYITASGGALRDWTVNERQNATVKDVLKHPTWNMGKKITVDSATLVNKAFEVIEASWLFDLPVEKIKVLLHKESLIHAMVTMKNATVQSCFFQPDMRIPLGYGLCHPRESGLPISSGQLWKGARSLSVHELKKNMFPCFDLIMRSAYRDRDLLVAVNAANDVAVESFLRGTIGFKHIYMVLKKVLTAFPRASCKNLEDILGQDQIIREYTREVIRKKYA